MKKTFITKNEIKMRKIDRISACNSNKICDEPQENLIKFSDYHENELNRICVVTCVWGRVDVFKLFIESINNLIVKPIVVVIGSPEDENEDKFVKLCNLSGFKYFSYDNEPLSNKWNYGIKKTLEQNYDYLLIMGSDDVLNNRLYCKYLIYNGDYCGLKDIYFFDTINNREHFWGGYTNHRKGEPIGAGRLVSRRIIEKMNGDYFNLGINSGLDRTFHERALKQTNNVVDVFSLLDNKYYLCDVKSDTNITKLSNCTNLTNVK